MLATSWKATGLIRPIWLRMPAKTYKREALAAATGIPASNLSAMNRGRLPVTPESAAKIMAAVPGVTLLDLGAPEVSDDAQSLLALDRLAKLEVALERVLLGMHQAGMKLPTARGDSRSAATVARSLRQTAGDAG